MVSLEKRMILTPLQQLPKNGENWGKLIVAKGFKKLPKVQKIARSGHTVHDHSVFIRVYRRGLQGKYIKFILLCLSMELFSYCLVRLLPPFNNTLSMVVFKKYIKG